MKRIDYFWPRAAVKVTAIVFFSQLLIEVIANRKQGFEWVLPVCGALFAAAVAWTLYAVVMNAIKGEA